MRRWIWWLLLGCGGVSLLVLFAVLDPQPYYHGRSLSAWLRLYHAANQHYPTDPEPAEALRQLGPRAVPYLLAWLPYERPAWKYRVVSVLNRMPGPARTVSTNLSQKLVRGWEEREAGYRMAVLGFGVLGPAARPAAAQLGRLALKGNGLAPERAARALIDMGTNAEPALPLLLAALRGAREPTASRAAWLLGVLPRVAPASLPPLVSSLKDSNPAVRVLTLRALGRLGDAAAPAIPALQDATQEPLTGGEARTSLMQIPTFAIHRFLDQLRTGNGDEQRVALNGLADLGRQGRAAVPALLQFAQQQPPLAFQITNTLWKIAPELVPDRAPSVTGPATRYGPIDGGGRAILQDGRILELPGLAAPRRTNFVPPHALMPARVPPR